MQNWQGISFTIQVVEQKILCLVTGKVIFNLVIQSNLRDTYSVFGKSWKRGSFVLSKLFSKRGLPNDISIYRGYVHRMVLNFFIHQLLAPKLLQRI